MGKREKKSNGGANALGGKRNTHPQAVWPVFFFILYLCGEDTFVDTFCNTFFARITCTILTGATEQDYTRKNYTSPPLFQHRSHLLLKLFTYLFTLVMGMSSQAPNAAAFSSCWFVGTFSEILRSSSAQNYSIGLRWGLYGGQSVMRLTFFRATYCSTFPFIWGRAPSCINKMFLA